MRLTEFWDLMDKRFGTLYARSVAVDYRLPALGSTVEEAIRRGVDTRAIWRAVVEEFDAPPTLR